VTKGRKEQEDLYKAFHADLQARDYSQRTPLQKLYGLWNEAKQNVPKPIFDPSVIFLAHTLRMKGWDIDSKPLLMDVHEVSFWMFPGEMFDWDRPVFAIRPFDGKMHEVFLSVGRENSDSSTGSCGGRSLSCHDTAPASPVAPARSSSMLPPPMTTRLVAAQSVVKWESYKAFMEQMMACSAFPQGPIRQDSLPEMTMHAHVPRRMTTAPDRSPS